MAMRKTLNSEAITALRSFLSKTPHTEKTAREKEAHAQTLAEKAGLEIHYRREGEKYKDGLNIYPPSDKGSIGAILFLRRRAYGWRWSLVRSFGHRWSF